MNLIELTKNRYSCRNYQSKAVEKKIETRLCAGMCANGSFSSEPPTLAFSHHQQRRRQTKTLPMINWNSMPTAASGK